MAFSQRTYRKIKSHLGPCILHLGEEACFLVCFQPVGEGCGINGGQKAGDDEKCSHCEYGSRTMASGTICRVDSWSLFGLGGTAVDNGCPTETAALFRRRREGARGRHGPMGVHALRGSRYYSFMDHFIRYYYSWTIFFHSWQVDDFAAVPNNLH